VASKVQPPVNQCAPAETVLDIVVTWNTRDNTNESICEFGIEGLHHRVKAAQMPTKFVDGGAKKATQYIHRVSNSAPRPLTIS